jgi:hypothetical protein
MDLVPLPQAPKNADRVLDRRLADHHRLEAPFECGVLLDVLAILIQRGCADGVELAARQHRLQHVRCVHRSFRCPGADDGVQLVDEQDHLSGGVGHFFEDGLQPLFELASVLRPGDERTHIQRDDPLVLEPLGNVLPDEALGQTFDDGRLADAGLADENRVVLRPPREDLDDAPDLLVTPDDRIQLAFARELREVAPVALQ